MFEIRETAQHLYNLLLANNVDLQTVQISPFGLTFEKDDKSREIIDWEAKPTLLSNILNNVGVNPGICVDCLTDDNLKNSEFFEFQMKAYVSFLLLKYGPSTAISKELAFYLVRHNLLEECVIYVGNSAQPLDASNMDLVSSEEEKFTLVQNA